MSDPFAMPSGRTDRALVSDEEFADSLATMVREFRIWHTGLGALFLFFCLLMLLVAGFMALGGLAGGAGDGLFMVAIGGVYAVMALTYGIPAVLLLRSGIAAMKVFSGVEDREPILESIRMQLWLWRLIGVMMLGFTLLYAGFFGLAFLFGIAATM